MWDLHPLGSADEASTSSGVIAWDPEAKQISDRECVGGKS
jgi:hypothetical protein